jgi:hypothetical protein
VFSRFVGSTAVSVLCIGIALVAIFVRLRRKDPLPLFLVLLFVGQIVFVRGFLFGAYGVAPRYYTPAFAALYWCVALGIEEIAGARRRAVVAPGMLALALLTWLEAPIFATYLGRTKPRANWRRLYDETRVLPGKKAFFADHGPYEQMLEYLARDDPDYLFFPNQYENAPGRNISLAGKPMTKAYLEKSVDKVAGEVSCFFYMNNKRKHDTKLFEPVFVAKMEERGFVEAFHSTSNVKLTDVYHDWFDVVGYCRPHLVPDAPPREQPPDQEPSAVPAESPTVPRP